MPQNHARELREHTPLSTRAKWLWSLSASIVVAAVVVVILTTTGSKTKLGCVETYLPGVIGAQSYDECGSAARRTCSTVEGSARQFGTAGVLIVEKACRRGHIPVG
jgi:predicted membrane-bound mannosyltransferase